VDDTPFVNDGADTSLRKAVSLLNKIEAKTGSATITGPVTVTNEVEIKNDAYNPLPVSDNNGSLTVDGTVELGSTSLAALENISVTFPATQNVNVTNAGLNVSVTNLPATQPVSGSVSVSNFPATQPVSGTFWQATQPVSGSVSVSNFPATQAVTLASPPVTPVTDNGGSLTVDGTFWPATQPVSGTVSVSNLPATQPVSGSVSLIELIPQDSTLELIVSAESIGGSYLKTDSSYYQGSGDNKLYWSSGSARWEFRGDNDYLWTYNNSANQSAAYIPKTGWVMGDNPYFKGVEIYARRDIDLVKKVVGLGDGYEAAASGDQTGLSVVAILKRGLVHLSSIIAKLPNLISNRIPVDGSGVTQPVSGTFWPATQPVSGTVSVSNFPATQPVSGTFWPTTQPVSGSVSVSNFPAIQPVSLATAPVTPISDNGGSLTVDGSITATQATAASLKAQAQLLNAAGSVVDYAMTGAAGTPATDVVTVQGISGGTSIPISGTVNTYPQQGTTATNTNFSSITSAELAPASANREALTVYNEGAGTLFINVGASCSTTSYQVRLLAGDYWEAPQGQVSLQHSGIFGTSGTGRVTQVT